MVDGDATLDGQINIDDYLAIDKGYQNEQSGTYTGPIGFFEGDFDHNGTIDFNDYALIDASYAAQGGGQAASEISLHTSEFGSAYTGALAADIAALPEPGSLALLGCGLITFCIRKRRN
jgi:PEP-CTERM motif-containing protein